MAHDSGSFSDHYAAMMLAESVMKAGSDMALPMLLELRHSIVAGSDFKSRIWLLPRVDELIEVAYAMRHTNRQSDPSWFPFPSAFVRAAATRRIRIGRLEMTMVRFAAVVSLAITIVKILWMELSG